MVQGLDKCVVFCLCQRLRIANVLGIDAEQASAARKPLRECQLPLPNVLGFFPQAALIDLSILGDKQENFRPSAGKTNKREPSPLRQRNLRPTQDFPDGCALFTHRHLSVRQRHEPAVHHQTKPRLIRLIWRGPRLLPNRLIQLRGGQRRWGGACHPQHNRSQFRKRRRHEARIRRERTRQQQPREPYPCIQPSAESHSGSPPSSR